MRTRILEYEDTYIAVLTYVVVYSSSKSHGAQVLALVQREDTYIAV
jgi:hypothetical protein